MTAQDAAQDGARDRAFVVLPADECRTLLATRQLGRIGLAGGEYPLILPVNYVLDGDAVVIRTDSPKITAAADHTRVAFEVDDVDDFLQAGPQPGLERGLHQASLAQRAAADVLRDASTGKVPEATWFAGTGSVPWWNHRHAVSYEIALTAARCLSFIDTDRWTCLSNV